jgi:hypothetical protein
MKSSDVLGFIIEVHDPLVQVECNSLPPIRQALKARSEHYWIQF